VSEYSLQTISVALESKESTVRRWTVMLEQSGYTFLKDNKARIYTEVDLELLKKIKDLTKGLTAEFAVSTALELINDSKNGEVQVDLEAEIAEMDALIKNFNHQYFWNAEQALQQLNQKWANLKGKCRSQIPPADDGPEER